MISECQASPWPDGPVRNDLSRGLSVRQLSPAAEELHVALLAPGADRILIAIRADPAAWGELVAAGLVTVPGPTVEVEP